MNENWVLFAAVITGGTVKAFTVTLKHRAAQAAATRKAAADKEKPCSS